MSADRSPHARPSNAHATPAPSRAGARWARRLRHAGALALLLLTMLAVAGVVTPRMRARLAHAAQPITQPIAQAYRAVAARVLPASSMAGQLPAARWEHDTAWATRWHADVASVGGTNGGDRVRAPLLPGLGGGAAGVLLRRDCTSAATPGCAAIGAPTPAQAGAPSPLLLVQAAATAPAIQTAHPRLLLDADTLTRLRAAASNNTAEWQALKATCDSYIGGTVNYPTGTQYPDKPNLGSGYQGEVYLPVLLDEAMCYQMLKVSNPTAAAPYGAKAVDILVKMSTPYTTSSGNQGWNPCYDDGYGMRNYGVGFGTGYDWVYELLSPSQRAQVYTTANAWITAWEQPGGCSDFVYKQPMNNYYAGYFHAKATIAIATYGDNPSAPAEWDDWYNNQFAQRVQPFYAKHLVGGGWLEGYANYAPPAIRHMTLAIHEVKTATGMDLVHASAAFPYPLDSAVYAMHFTWPSRAYFDDRDTNHANGTATPPVGTTQFGMFQQLLGEQVYWNSPNVAVFNQYTNEVNAATAGYNPSAPWLVFLNAYPDVPTQSVSTLPNSYLASGLGMLAARSDWSTSASWMSFRAAPYIENPDQSEEGFDQGSLALARGNTPLLVNASGWLVHEPNGSSDENLVYADLFNSFDGTVYHGNRQLYNIYYTRKMSGSTVAERYGQAAYTQEDNNVSTKIAAYEDRDGYVYAQATGLADMYRAFTTGPAVSSWTRQLVYLRPNRFIVYDRTVSGSSGYDQFLAWHFPANPATGTAGTGQNRLDISYQGQFVGSMTTVLPANAKLTTIGLYPTSNPTKVWQVQERPADTNAAQQWLTVFDLSTTAAAVAKAAPVTVSQGAMVGVQLSSSAGNDVVLQSTAAAGTPVSLPMAYTVPAQQAHHVITELAPNTGYNVTASVSGNNLSIQVSAGGTFISSPAGVLDFYVDAGGTVQLKPPVKLTAPISSLPVAGFPKPYP